MLHMGRHASSTTESSDGKSAKVQQLNPPRAGKIEKQATKQAKEKKEQVVEKGPGNGRQPNGASKGGSAKGAVNGDGQQNGHHHNGGKKSGQRSHHQNGSRGGSSDSLAEKENTQQTHSNGAPVEGSGQKGAAVDVAQGNVGHPSPSVGQQREKGGFKGGRGGPRRGFSGRKSGGGNKAPSFASEGRQHGKASRGSSPKQRSPEGSGSGNHDSKDHRHPANASSSSTSEAEEPPSKNSGRPAKHVGGNLSNGKQGGNSQQSVNSINHVASASMDDPDNQKLEVKVDNVGKRNVTLVHDRSQSGKGSKKDRVRQQHREKESAQPRDQVKQASCGSFYLKDPKGKKLGPFSAADLVAWFDDGLQVCEADNGSWENLRGATLSRLRKWNKQQLERQGVAPAQAAAAQGGNQDKPAEQAVVALPQRQTKDHQRRGTPSSGKKEQDAGSDKQPSKQDKPEKAKEKEQPASQGAPTSQQKQQPAAAPTNSVQQPKTGLQQQQQVAAAQQVQAKTTMKQEPQKQQQESRGKDSSTSYKKNVKYNDLVVVELFTGGVKNNPTEEPVWRYVDNEQQIQGPWTSKQMISWYKQGYFELNLNVVGCERKLCPPNLPGREQYQPLGRLLQDKAAKMPGHMVHTSSGSPSHQNRQNNHNYRRGGNNYRRN